MNSSDAGGGEACPLLLSDLQAGYREAAFRLGEEQAVLCLGGLSVRLNFAGRSLQPVFMPAMSHTVAADTPTTVDLDLRLWETASSGVPAPRPDWSQVLLGRRGVLRECSDAERRVAFDWGTRTVQAIDRPQRCCVYWAPKAEAIPYWERSFPFRQLLTWHLGASGMHPVHAACVGWQGRGILLPGASGSGKTTTSLLCAQAGFTFLGDDYVLLDVRDRPTVHCLYRTAKLDDRAWTLLPSLAARATRVSPTDEKAIFYWPDSGPAAVGRSAPLTAIVLPRVAGGPRSTLEPTSAGEAVMALVPTTHHHLDTDAAALLSLARRAAEELPVFRLMLGQDLNRIPELLKDV